MDLYLYKLPSAMLCALEDQQFELYRGKTFLTEPKSNFLIT